MKFLNALAWVGLVYSVVALIVPLLLISAETKPLILAAREIHYQQHAPYRLLLATVSILWLIFGGK